MDASAIIVVELITHKKNHEAQLFGGLITYSKTIDVIPPLDLKLISDARKHQ